MALLEDDGDTFEGEAEAEQRQSGEDVVHAADQVEESEYCIAEESDAKAELEQKEHGRVWYVFMLSSLVLEAQEGQLLYLQFLGIIESTQEEFLAPPSDWPKGQSGRRGKTKSSVVWGISRHRSRRLHAVTIGVRQRHASCSGDLRF